MCPPRIIEATDLFRRKSMPAIHLYRLRGFAVLCFLLATLCTLLAAETVKIEGVIVGRSGDEIIVADARRCEGANGGVCDLVGARVLHRVQRGERSAQAVTGNYNRCAGW